MRPFPAVGALALVTLASAMPAAGLVKAPDVGDWTTTMTDGGRWRLESELCNGTTGDGYYHLLLKVAGHEARAVLEGFAECGAYDRSTQYPGVPLDRQADGTWLADGGMFGRFHVAANGTLLELVELNHVFGVLERFTQNPERVQR